MSKQKEIITRTEQWLDERFIIMNMENPPHPANVEFYNGAITAVEFLGYKWKRDNAGKHKLLK